MPLRSSQSSLLWWIESSYPSILRSCWSMLIFTLSPASLVSTMMYDWILLSSNLLCAWGLIVDSCNFRDQLIHIHSMPHLKLFSPPQISGPSQKIKGINRETLTAILKSTAEQQMVRFLWSFTDKEDWHLSCLDSIPKTRRGDCVYFWFGLPRTFLHILIHLHFPLSRGCCLPILVPA